MVALPLKVRYFGQLPVTCNARAILNQAHAAVERGEWIEAGCRLREAVRVYLLAEVEYHRVEVSKRKARQTPRALLTALHRAEVCGDYCRERIDDAIEIGNRAAHCKFVSVNDLGDALAILHWCLDEAKYLQQPAAAGRLS